MSSSDHVEVRSFRSVFKFRRRLFKIDKWRLPWPYGVELRQIGYAVAAAVVITQLSRLPGIGAVLEGIPTTIRLIVLPVFISMGLTQFEPDGRGPHQVVASWLSWWVSPRHLAGFQRTLKPGSVVAPLGTVTFEHDPFTDHYRPGTIIGTGSQIILRYAADLEVHQVPVAGLRARLPRWLGGHEETRIEQLVLRPQVPQRIITTNNVIPLAPGVPLIIAPSS